jgi:molybdenum cofactor synthesis domain-containing protein
MKVAILTISDRCSRGEMEDTSGPALERIAMEKLSAQIVATKIVPDEIVQISDQIKTWALYSPKPDLILTTGGTGLAARDVTPEATLLVLERRHPALLELARLRCLPKTPRTYLSRGEAGTVGQTLIINLPGSQRGASEFLEALLDVLPHAVALLQGDTAH